ncbi:hypothetical protein ABPG75_006794 [Micractinium tetrahymenae]
MAAEEPANGGAAVQAEEEEDLDALWGDEAPRRPVAPQPAAEPSSSEEDSYFGGSGDESEDSAARRAREAAARVKDYGEGEEAASAQQQPARGGGSGAQGGLLPSAVAAFTSVEGPPAFLDPEATRPLAAAVHRAVNNVGPEGGPPPDPQSSNRLLNKRGQAAGDWDVSQMAPKLKEQQQQEVGVITGQAVRYRTDDRVELGGVSGAQIAMLGGHVKADDEEGGAAGAGKHPAPKGKPTRPMGVDEFLDKGLGGAQLPRKRQDRKDKEKEKRMRGQSTHAQWKSEAEMVLRQQYD